LRPDHGEKLRESNLSFTLARDKGIAMWLLDFPTLVIIIAAGLDLGVLGFLGYDAATAAFGAHTKIAYMVVGCAAAWQLFRQKFR
jgi:uncharacterized membrane protein YuzA (DUF378 family)